MRSRVAVGVMALLLLVVVRLGLSRPPQADLPAMQTGWGGVLPR